MQFHLYRCRGKLLLANDAKMVSEHINRGYKRKAPVDQMPEGSVVLIHDTPYDVDALLAMSKRQIKNAKIDYDRPLSIVINQLIVQ